MTVYQTIGEEWINQDEFSSEDSGPEPCTARRRFRRRLG